MRKKAFTLIELLVVIAIIALLLSIIMPGLKRAKNYAQRLVCRSNTRSLAISLRIYAEQNDGEIFPYDIYSLYINQLAVYIDDMDKVRYCPSTKINYGDTPMAVAWGQGSSSLTWCWRPDDVKMRECGAYAFSGWLYSYPGPLNAPPATWVGTTEVTEYAWQKYYNVKSSANVPIFMDSNWVDAWPKDTDTIPANLDLEYGGFGADNPVHQHIERLMLRRHWGFCSLAFADGHADSYELRQLWQFNWSRKFVSRGGDMKRLDGKPIYQP